MALEVTRSGRDVLVRVVGAFDETAAERLCSLITGAGGPPGTSSIVVDFSRAREVTPVALAVLVACQSDAGVALRFRGLSRGHSRMLSYLEGGSRGEG